MLEKQDAPKVSIIVPIYNVGKYLEQCVNSLIQQTYKNLQIILVDDGSTDCSGAICDHFAAKDHRVLVIHKKNGGLTDARKTGKEAAIGEYIVIVDGDDWLDHVTIEACMAVMKKKDIDCVMFGYVREYEKKSILNPLFEKDFIYERNEVKQKIYRRLIGPIGEELKHPEKLDNLGSMCMKMYKKELMNKGKFVSEREVGTNEDSIFNIYALKDCKKIAYINRCFYHYRKTNENSITMTYKKGLQKKWDKMYREFYLCLEENKMPRLYYQAFYNRVACGMIGLGLNEVSSKEHFMKVKNEISIILNKKMYHQAFEQLETSWCPVYWKIFFMLCRHRCSLLLVILLKLINRLRSWK